MTMGLGLVTVDGCEVVGHRLTGDGRVRKVDGDAHIAPDVGPARAAHVTTRRRSTFPPAKSDGTSTIPSPRRGESTSAYVVVGDGGATDAVVGAVDGDGHDGPEGPVRVVRPYAPMPTGRFSSPLQQPPRPGPNLPPLVEN